MKKYVCVWLLICVTAGMAFAQNRLTKEEQDLVADELNNVVSQLNGLDVIISTLTSAIPILSTIEDKKGQFDDLKNILKVFEAGKAYKNASRAGDKEAARQKLLQANLNLTNFASKGMGAIQGMVLPLVVQAVSNTAKTIQRTNAILIFNAEAARTGPWDESYEDLAAPKYDKYKSIGLRMLLNSNEDQNAWNRIRIVLQALEESQNPNNYRGTTNPIKYDIGQKLGGGLGTVFMSNSSGTMTCTADRGACDWNAALALERDIKDGKGMGGIKGWRLPTSAELNEIYKNRQNLGLTFSNESFWAKDGNNAYAMNFGNGATNTSPNRTESKHIVLVRKR
jgi:hypothetical protein